jgi:hypothetical protein
MTPWWSDDQRKFVDMLFTPLFWCDAGSDRFKITHRKDGRFQISWQYQTKDINEPYTVSDHSGFIYLSYAEMHQILKHLRKIVAECGL